MCVCACVCVCVCVYVCVCVCVCVHVCVVPVCDVRLLAYHAFTMHMLPYNICMYCKVVLFV